MLPQYRLRSNRRLSRRRQRRRNPEQLEARRVLAAPVPMNDEFDSIQGDVSGMQLDVLNNDVDPDGDPISISAVTQPSSGASVTNENSALTYFPAFDFIGTDEFTYTVSDGTESATASVTIYVLENQPPFAYDDFVSLSTGTDVSVLIDLLANDTDPDGHPIHLSSLGTPESGQVFDNFDGTVLYLLPDGFIGEDRFTYTISDGISESFEGQVTISAQESSPPFANDDFLTTNMNESIAFNPLENDQDPDGDPFFLAGIEDPNNGVLEFLDGNFIQYTPNAGFVGNDFFTYTISNSDGQEALGFVSIDVVQDTPLELTQVLVNDGFINPDDLPPGPQPTSWELQRSDLRRLTLQFSGELSPVDATALTLTNLGVNAPQDADNVVDLTANGVTIQTSGNTLQIDFAPYHLDDGVYQLDGSISGIGGESLSFSVVGNNDNGLYKLAGEWNGDRGVSIFDFSSFSYWFNQAQAPEYLDINLDGGISVFDFPAFASNFGGGIVFPPVAKNARSAPPATATSPQDDFFANLARTPAEDAGSSLLQPTQRKTDSTLQTNETLLTREWLRELNRPHQERDSENDRLAILGSILADPNVEL